VLDSSRGVTVEKVEPLVYRRLVSGQVRTFALNDLSGVKPPAGALGPDEKFIGPIFDEAAIRIFLVFNRKLRIFHYVLDETEPVAERFFSPKEDGPHPGRQAHGIRVLPGSPDEPEDHDRRLRRKHAGQQLFRRTVRPAPGQLHRGRGLREAILERAAAAQGPDRPLRQRAGRQHPFHDRALSAVIGEVTDLDPIHACAVQKQKQPDYYRCFVTDDESGGMVAPKPKRGRRGRA
jgi:hypothetical protein